ncbi:hypothetical protein BN133_2831 [Cronobacter dublinensis 582]|nr:hypothetical protein BN133_2831 [Cronobacter dublinensis 582]
MVAQPKAVAAVGGRHRQFIKRFDQRRGLFAGQRQEGVFVDPEIQKRGQTLAAAEEILEFRDVHVHFAQQDHIRVILGQQVIEVVEKPVAALPVTRQARLLHHMRGRIDAKARHAFLSPEAQHPVDGLDNIGVAQVEIRLVMVKEVAVITLRLFIKAPDMRLDGRKHRRGLIRPRRVAPEVEIMKGVVAALARLQKPAVSVGRVLRHQLDNHPDLALARLGNQPLHILQRADARVGFGMVFHVIAVIASRREIKRGQPDGGRAKRFDIVELFDNAAQVSPAVGVAVKKTRGIYLVNDGVLVPQTAHKRTPFGGNQLLV